MQREVWSCCCKLLRNLGFKKETTAFFFFLIWQIKSVGFWVCKIWFTVSVNRCHWSALVGPQETHAFGENWVKLKSSELGRYKCQLRMWPYCSIVVLLPTSNMRNSICPCHCCDHVQSDRGKSLSYAACTWIFFCCIMAISAFKISILSFNVFAYMKCKL